MAANVIDEYLVDLKFNIDQPNVAKFNGVLKGVASEVSHYTGGMAHDLLKWQGTIVGAFVAAGGAMLGLLDHLADTDQNFRLLGEHMFISKNAAKEMTMATDALGVSLQDAIWDPELHQRFNKLIEDQRRMEKALGMGDLDKNMRYLRDVKFEYQRFTLEMKEGMFAVGNQLARALGGTDLLTTLQHWNEYIIQHLPEWTKDVSDFIQQFGPDFKSVFLDVKKIAEEVAIAFTNIVAAFHPKDNLGGDKFDPKKLATAFKDAVDDLTKFVDEMTKAVTVTLRLVDALAKLTHGDLSGAVMRRWPGRTSTPAPARCSACRLYPAIWASRRSAASRRSCSARPSAARRSVWAARWRTRRPVQPVV